MTTTTQTDKVANALSSGAELTAKQISHRYGLRRRNMNLIMETSTIKHRK